MPSFQNVTLPATGSVAAADGSWRSNDLVGALGSVGTDVKLYNIALTTSGRLSFYVDYSELTGVGTHTFYVTRTHGTVGAISVDFDSYGDAHTTASGTISFTDGQAGIKSFTVAVPTKADAGDHRIYVQLSNPTNSAVLHNGTKTIAYGVIDDGTIAVDANAVFYDSAAGAGTGTQADPYGSIYTAIANVGSKRYIYGRGTTVPDGTDLYVTTKVINPPATRADEGSRVYIRNWPGNSWTITSSGGTDSAGFYTDAGEDYQTYRGIVFSALSSTSQNQAACFGVFYRFGSATSINIEHCIADDINGASGANNGAFKFDGVDSVKVWRSTSNNIQTAGDNTNGNTGGVYSYDAINLSVQRCEMSLSAHGVYQKRIANITDATASLRFNIITASDAGVQYGSSATADPAPAYTVIQSNLFKDCYTAIRPNSGSQGQPQPEQQWWCSNVFDTCGSGALAAIPFQNTYKTQIFNNVFLDCRAVWNNRTDSSSIAAAVEYADYNNETGTTWPTTKYMVDGIAYTTSAALFSATGFGGNDTQNTPLFINPSINDYTLQGESSLLAAGVDGTDQGIYLTGIEVIGAGATSGVVTDVKLYSIALTTAGRLSFYVDYSELTGVGTHTFYVTRTHGTSGLVSVDYDSYGDAHTTASGTITFADGQAGVKSFTVAVPTKTDAGDHRIYVQLSNPTNSAVLHHGTKTIAYGVIDDGTVPIDADAIFFDTASGSNGTGTAANPYNNVNDAITNVGSKRYICGKGTVVPNQSVGAGGTVDGIEMPATRTNEATRLYIQKWPGFTLTVDGSSVTNRAGFYGNSGESYHTYKGIDFANLDTTGTGSECYGVMLQYGGSTDINVEYCSGDDLNGATNTAMFQPWGVDGGKMWRCTTNNIQVNGVNTNENAAGMLTFDGKNLTVQRNTFTLSDSGVYHKRIATLGDVSTRFSFNISPLHFGVHYGFSGTSGHSYAIVQGNLFEGCSSSGVYHVVNGDTSTVPTKSLYITNNIFDSCGAGETGAILCRNAYENVIFNNIFLNCRKTWADVYDSTGIKTPTMEYADYNNDFGTTLTSQRYELAAVNYSTAAALPDSLGDNDSTLDPEFTNAASDDYTLAALSNSIGSGVGSTNRGIYLTGIEVVGS
jgi:ribosomal protein L35AE/L33A